MDKLPPPIDAGRLRHRIIIESPTFTRDSTGAASPGTPVTVATVWAAIDPLSGRQLDQARSFAATVSHKITIRYRKGLDPTMRIRFGARVFAVNALINLQERNRQIDIYATEIVVPPAPVEV